MTISILACGWLGLPLGKYFSNTKNWEIKGSTTQLSKIKVIEEAGIKAFQIELSPEMKGEEIADFLNTDILLVNIPPRESKNGKEYHILQIADLIKKISQYNPKVKVIFISSTSVYQSNNTLVDENSLLSNNSQLVIVEKMLEVLPNDLTILRCGGLMGYDRFPAKYSTGRVITNGNTPVNYIHRDDVIGCIENIISNQVWNETFNLVSPYHPLRKDIFTKNCIDLGLALPIFDETGVEEAYKIISPQKMISRTNYEFKFQNPLDFEYLKS